MEVARICVELLRKLDVLTKHHPMEKAVSRGFLKIISYDTLHRKIDKFFVENSSVFTISATYFLITINLHAANILKQ